jgi:hypothetical protein
MFPFTNVLNFFMDEFPCSRRGSLSFRKIFLSALKCLFFRHGVISSVTWKKMQRRAKKM